MNIECESDSFSDKINGFVSDELIKIGSSYPYRSVSVYPMQLLNIFLNPFGNHKRLLLSLRSARILNDLLSQYSSPILAINLFVKTLWLESINYSNEELKQIVKNLDDMVMVYLSVKARPDWLRLGLKFTNYLVKSKKKITNENVIDDWILKYSPKITVTLNPFFARVKLTILKQSAEEKSLPTNFIRPLSAFICECNKTHVMESKSLGEGTLGSLYYNEFMLALLSYSENNQKAFIFLMKQMFIYNLRHVSYFSSFAHAAIAYCLPFFENILSAYAPLFQSHDFSDLIECIIPTLPGLAPYAALRGEEFTKLYEFFMLCKNNYHKSTLKWDDFLQDICLNALQVQCNRSTANLIVREILPQCFHKYQNISAVVWLSSLYLGSNFQLAKVAYFLNKKENISQMIDDNQILNVQLCEGIIPREYRTPSLSAYEVFENVREIMKIIIEDKSRKRLDTAFYIKDL